MKEIIKVLLQEGIDEETIHEVLDVIEESIQDQIKKVYGEPKSEPAHKVLNLSTGKLVDVPYMDNKAHRLTRKAEEAQGKELHRATVRKAGVKETNPDKWTGKDRNALQDAYDQIEAERTETKNTKGEQKTRKRGIMADIKRRRETGARPNK